VNWNESKWAVSNAQIGLKRDEICPGLTLDDHAESLAMFDMHALNANNKAWHLAVLGCAAFIKKRIMSPMNGSIDTTNP
jgi:hypothetical protein